MAAGALPPPDDKDKFSVRVPPGTPVPEASDSRAVWPIARQGRANPKKSERILCGIESKPPSKAVQAAASTDLFGSRAGSCSELGLEDSVILSATGPG